MKYILLATLLLVGCATDCQTVIHQTTAFPVMPTIEAPQHPTLKIDELTDADKQDSGKVAQYYNATIEQLDSYAAQLKIIVDEYVKAGQEVNRLTAEEKAKNGTQ